MLPVLKFRKFSYCREHVPKISEILRPRVCLPKISEILLPGVCPPQVTKIPRYQNFGILVLGKKSTPGSKISEISVPRDKHARGFQKEARKRTRLQRPGARPKKRRRPAGHRLNKECLILYHNRIEITVNIFI